MALVDAPFGVATKAIRRHDPLWARPDGEKFEWEIQIRRRGADRGVAYVKASSQEEADKLAEDLTECEIEWDCDPDDFTIVSVEPVNPGSRG